MSEKLIPSSVYTKTIYIQASPEKIWAALTVPELMQQWMLDEEIRIYTDWTPGSTFILMGELNQKPFENIGTVLTVDPYKCLSYTHLSSISQLADVPDNHTIYTFTLEFLAEGANLKLTIANFPTESIYKHLVFYWNVTMGILKTFIEKH